MRIIHATMECCAVCHRKLNLIQAIAGKCRCGQLLCPRHKDTATHECSFDYQGSHRRHLESNLPPCQAPKVTPI